MTAEGPNPGTEHGKGIQEYSAHEPTGTVYCGVVKRDRTPGCGPSLPRTQKLAAVRWTYWSGAQEEKVPHEAAPVERLEKVREAVGTKLCVDAQQG